MNFDLDKTVQTLKEVLNVNQHSTIEWVKSVWDGSLSHRQFEVKVSSTLPSITDPSIVTWVEVPDYETTFTLLRKFGTLDQDLVDYLKVSFSQNKPQYLIIANFHDSWISRSINVKSDPILKAN